MKDPVGEDLARHFLGEGCSHRDARTLAQCIQDIIEDWLIDHGNRARGTLPPPE